MAVLRLRVEPREHALDAPSCRPPSQLRVLDEPVGVEQQWLSAPRHVSRSPLVEQVESERWSWRQVQHASRPLQEYRRWVPEIDQPRGPARRIEVAGAQRGVGVDAAVPEERGVERIDPCSGVRLAAQGDALPTCPQCGAECRLARAVSADVADQHGQPAVGQGDRIQEVAAEVHP